MIRLSNKSDRDKFQIRELWKNCFGDSEEFTDFYFESVFPRNITVVTEESAEIIGMIHLNPYIFSVGQDTVKTYFIVGVAVHPAYRLQGRMRQMMEYAFSLMRQEGILFTYLWPADVHYYMSLGFRKATELVRLKLSPEQLTELLSACGTLEEYTGFENGDFYVPQYSAEKIRDLKNEMASEGGEFVVLQDEDHQAGYFAAVPYEGILEVNHVIPCGRLNRYLHDLIQYAIDRVSDYNSKKDGAEQLRMIRFSVDKRIYQMLCAGWKETENGYLKKSGMVLESDVSEDHIYMIKLLCDEGAVTSQNFLFTEIV